MLKSQTCIRFLFPYCHERSRVHGIFPVILFSRQSYFQTFEYVLKRAKWQLVATCVSSLIPTTNLILVCPCTQAKDQLKDTPGSLLETKSSRHINSNTLRIICWKRPDYIRKMVLSWMQPRSQGSLPCFEKERRLRLVTRKCVSINCAAEVGLLIGPSLNLVDWRNMRYYLG